MDLAVAERLFIDWGVLTKTVLSAAVFAGIVGGATDLSLLLFEFGSAIRIRKVLFYALLNLQALNTAILETSSIDAF